MFLSELMSVSSGLLQAGKKRDVSRRGAQFNRLFTKLAMGKFLTRHSVLLALAGGQQWRRCALLNCAGRFAGTYERLQGGVRFPTGGRHVQACEPASASQRCPGCYAPGVVRRSADPVRCRSRRYSPDERRRPTRSPCGCARACLLCLAAFFAQLLRETTMSLHHLSRCIATFHRANSPRSLLQTGAR